MPRRSKVTTKRVPLRLPPPRQLPQVLARGMDEDELPVYDEKVDVWSVGALLFEALTGFQPFLADGAAEMAATVAARLADRDPETGLPAFLSRQPALSADAKDFIARCLEARPEARPSAAELLAHPWLERRASLAGDGRAVSVTAAAAAASSCAAPAWQLEQPAGARAAAPPMPPHSSASSIAAGAPADGARKGAGAGGAGEEPRGAGLGLHRSSSAGDAAAGPHLSMRSRTGRMEGSRPGTRAAAAAALAATALSGGGA
jgi:hypothetical protein